MIKFFAKMRQSVILNGLQRSIFSSSEKDSVIAAVDDSHTSTPDTKYTSEEIDRIRDKSRIPVQIRKTHFQEEMPELNRPFHYELHKLRRYYGRYGKQSGLNPGLCWPTPDELEYKMEYKRLAYPTLQQMVSLVKQRRNAETKAMLKLEKSVVDNMKKLIIMNKEIEDLAAKKEAAVKAQMMKKEQLVDEVREFFGYNLSASDPRVKDLIERRQEEAKAKAKAAKKKAKYGKKEKFDLEKQVGILAQRVKKVKPVEEPDSDDD